MEVLQQSGSSQIRINQNNTKKFHSSGGGWRYKATKNSGRNSYFCIDIKTHKYLYILFLCLIRTGNRYCGSSKLVRPGTASVNKSNGCRFDLDENCIF